MSEVQLLSTEINSPFGSHQMPAFLLKQSGTRLVNARLDKAMVRHGSA
jgi:hypothetical protein